ncbi:MAG: hypothetical protein JSR86_07225 [Proteobacteria bacterium]|nr:hypothetical protein [Pseudomonadota bacterium]
MHTRLKPVDAFVGVNVLLLAAGSALFVLQRLNNLEARSNLAEMVVYVLTIAAAIVAGWRRMRRAALPLTTLGAMQLGILSAFAGGVVHIHGMRLYDTDLLGLPFDKWVHGLNAVAGMAFTQALLQPAKGVVPRGLAVLLIVQGCGAIVEAIEYVCQALIPNTGVGGYDNNMQDLLANLGGGLIYLAAQAAWGVIARAGARRAPAA